MFLKRKKLKSILKSNNTNPHNSLTNNARTKEILFQNKFILNRFLLHVLKAASSCSWSYPYSLLSVWFAWKHSWSDEPYHTSLKLHKLPGGICSSFGKNKNVESWMCLPGLVENRLEVGCRFSMGFNLQSYI